MASAARRAGLMCGWFIVVYCPVSAMDAREEGRRCRRDQALGGSALEGGCTGPGRRREQSRTRDRRERKSNSSETPRALGYSRCHCARLERRHSISGSLLRALMPHTKDHYSLLGSDVIACDVSSRTARDVDILPGLKAEDSYCARSWCERSSYQDLCLGGFLLLRSCTPHPSLTLWRCATDHSSTGIGRSPCFRLIHRPGRVPRGQNVL